MSTEISSANLRKILNKYKNTIDIGHWITIGKILDELDDIQDDLIKCNQSFENSQIQIEAQAKEMAKMEYKPKTFKEKIKEKIKILFRR